MPKLLPNKYASPRISGKYKDCSMPVTFDTAISKLSNEDVTLICYVEEGTLTLKEVFNKNSNPKNINVFIGPEGGFTKKEWKTVVSKGALSVTLGKRILKGETAGLFVTAAAMYHYDELA